MTGQSNWIDVGSVDDIPLRGARRVKTSWASLAIFRTAGGGLFALEDKCPHLGGPLSEGIVHGEAVTCPLHNLVIDLASGQALGPDGGCVLSVPVRIEGERVLLDTDAIAQREAV